MNSAEASIACKSEGIERLHAGKERVGVWTVKKMKPVCTWECADLEG